MSRKRYKPEQVINLLREAEDGLSQGKKVGEVCRSLGISEQSYYRWRAEYGGMQLAQVKPLKELAKVARAGDAVRRVRLAARRRS